MDDDIIYSWCFNSVECYYSTSSAAIIILVKNLESLSSLRSQHKVVKEVTRTKLDELVAAIEAARLS